MFKKTKEPSGESPSTPSTSRKIAPSVISSDVNLLGNLISDGLIDFDGNIHGNIQCHTLVIRKQARIHGEIKADSVQVGGTVKGSIEARSVVLQSGAEVEGTIMHEQITVEEGATIDGKLKKIDNAKSPALLEQSMPMSKSHHTINATGFNHDDDDEKNEDFRIMEHIKLIAANE